jgi:hypothetical protein
MLRRIFSLTIVLASLLLSGLPAVACAECAPTRDCCPSEPLAPCGIEASVAPPSYGIQPCGASSAVTSAAFAAVESSNEFHKHLKRSDVPAILISAAISPTSYVAPSRSTAISSTSSFRPSYVSLYLSTGRLRL